jgi:hypothetical protein
MRSRAAVEVFFSKTGALMYWSRVHQTAAAQDGVGGGEGETAEAVGVLR